MKCTVAAVQMTSGSDKKMNLTRAKVLMREGVDRGASLIALPENFAFMGDYEEKLAAAEEEGGGEAIDLLKETAARHKVWILGGSLPIRAKGKKVFNTSFLIDDKGAIAARYDKIHLFDVDVPGGESHRESASVQAGKKTVVAKTPFGKAGLTVCYDLRFPELYRMLAKKGAEIIFIPSAFTVQTGRAHWEILIRARAIENQAFIVAPAQVGRHSATRRTFGNSMIVDPWGKIITKATAGEQVITGEIDFSLQAAIRKGMPVFDHIVLKG